MGGAESVIVVAVVGVFLAVKYDVPRVKEVIRLRQKLGLSPGDLQLANYIIKDIKKKHINQYLRK